MCGTKFRANDALAGRTVPCSVCQTKLHIPDPDAPRPTEEPPSHPAASDPAPPEPEPQRAEPPRPPSSRPSRLNPASDPPPLKSQETPGWLRHLHWLLALALLPLVFSLTAPEQPKTILDHLKETLQEATPLEQVQIILALQKIENTKKTDLSPDEILGTIPSGKFSGAFLPRHTWAHWLFAAGSVVLFMTFLVFLASDGSAQPGHLLGLGAFTATVGIVFLFIVQFLASMTRGMLVSGNIVIMAVFYVLKLIGFSYRAALEADSGFFLSFLGFTLGVGLCEELVKALPLIVYYQQPREQSWRGALLWGMASGAGFGIAEGIMYSRDFYNGISGADDYLVRFLSCVALHAVWTGSAAIMLQQNQEMLQKEGPWYDHIPPVLVLLAVPVLLHGLYDTLLKQEMQAWALVMAILSFLFLALLIMRLRGGDDDEARARFLDEYKRRRMAAN
jgi:RsiW-degrading membrane proteinase PrsW (M82 family)